MKTVRVNVRTTVNNAQIRREKRNGRDVIVVPSATLPDNVVMNRILYPADVIESGYKSLERTPAPLGHPTLNGVYINANDPEAINSSWVGAWNENVRRENGRVFLDKVVDVQRAESTDEGKQLLDAINKGDPIHTSTGLYLDTEEATHADYDLIARAMVGDHDCFLLGEQGAATPEQGVGVFVNSQGDKVPVVNSVVPAQDAIDIATEILMDSAEREDRKAKWASMRDILAGAIKDIFNPNKEADGLNVNQSEESEMDAKEIQAMLDAQAEKLMAANTEAVKAAVEPIQKELDQIKANREAEQNAKRDELTAKVVKANLLDEETCKTLDVNALEKLAEKAKPGSAAPINGYFAGNADEDEAYWSKQDLNANIDAGGAQ